MFFLTKSVFVCKRHFLMTSFVTSSPRDDIAVLGEIF